MDTLTETQDADRAVETAQLHLDGVREQALNLYRLLDSAHNDTAHIVVADHLVEHAEEHTQDITPLVPRPENRQPPSMGRDGTSGPRLW